MNQQINSDTYVTSGLALHPAENALVNRFLIYILTSEILFRLLGTANPLSSKIASSPSQGIQKTPLF
ncbi:MAG: hypothetical protein WCT77_02295 [Bacteroidota bacterium]